jgi:hypothetical protein
VLELFAVNDADVNDEDVGVGSAGNDEAEAKEEEVDIGLVKEEAVEANGEAVFGLVADELKYVNGRFGAYGGWH